MVKEDKKDTVPDKIEATLSFPNLNLNFTSNNPIGSLRELHKILNSLRAMEITLDTDIDDPLYFRFVNLSEELRNNTEVMNFIRNANKVEENIKQKKVSLENIKVLDFDNKSYTTNVDTTNLQKKVNTLTRGVEHAGYAVVHIISGAPSTEKQGIIDNIKNKLPKADIKPVFTNKELLGKTVIEGVFFGDFGTDYYYE